jgi:acetyl esterase
LSQPHSPQTLGAADRGSSPIQIHPELQSVKAHPLPTNRVALGALQAFLRLVNRVHRRKFRRVLRSELIRSEDGYRVPTLIIRPAQGESRTPALVYFHGGSFVMEGTPIHVENAVRYANEANCTVLFVEYRLAPHHVFPAGFNDCYAVLKWTIANAVDLKIDTSRIAVGGDSAGGNLAAGVAQKALHQDNIALSGQLLIYPAVDLLCTRPSMHLFKDVPPFKALSAQRIAQAYLGGSPAKPLPEYSSPIDGTLNGLPPAYIETPELDPLHDQGAEYARMLQGKGVEVESNDIIGAVHGFDLLVPKSGVSHEAMQRRIRFLQRIFGS